MSDDPIDVLIIGAGASGAAVAWSLMDTRMHIVCMEQGGVPDSGRFPSTGLDWEARRAGDHHISPNRRGWPEDYPVNDDHSPIKVANYNGVGGGTVLYAAHFPRFHPSDFRVRTLDGVADDWPVDYETLEPFFAENDRMMGVAGLAGDPAYPPGKTPPMPPIPMGRSGRRLAEAFNTLGWHWWPCDLAIATEAYDGRAPCINLGACLSGCAQGAKGSVDVTYWPHAQRGGVEMRTSCRVREIAVDENDMATGVVYFDEKGVERFQAAHVLILAANGVGTPRVLLNSVSKAFPEGLANRSGLVGKNLMFHPYAAIQGVFDDPLDGYKGAHKSILSQEFYETDPQRGFVRGYTFETSRGMGPAATVLAGLEWGEVPLGDGHHAAARKLMNRVTSLAAICEDLPEEHNRVSLDPDLVDSNGIPAPRISYTLSENSRAMLDHACEKGREIMTAAGARKVFTTSPIPMAGWHLLGTARMGTDPERSVVNEWGRSHDVRNLFIVDGSIFVTSGGVNPTSTLQAMSLYIADQIKRRLTNLFD
ncbi:GMC family oxidoreductase [Sedimentitalea todarodis]|uniref:GMC family oxidoreductase n=1 Tax=Sedimentitalea todarodis TaxID=1631240 RepID=A0ABU3VLN6_9RHOB|nr:GMC family oxidoreductase [Sedimentitalea todarodis]MDU9007091.1 GMC family oxidoreductase [Sedimentitalea todarodis]